MRSALPVLALAASLLGPLSGCSSSEAVEPTCEPGPSKAYVLTSLTFTRESPRGVAPGFDLDDRVTSAPEDPSCGKVDLVSPTGEKGIDNQLALLIPEVEKRVGNAIDGIIQGAINDGRLLIMFDLQNVNDPADDKCVDLEVKLGEGKPTLGTDGVIEAYQTFDLRKEGQLLSFGKAGKLEKRVFSIGPFPLRIPIAVFDVSFTIYVRDAVIRFTLDEEGNVEGMLGGGVSIDEIAEGVKNGAGIADLIPQIKLIGRASSDMGYDTEEGTCSLVSAALAFKARPAFVRK
jgi:hypothetical protein